MSNTLASALRKSTSLYNERWVEQTRRDFATEPKPETIEQHLRYWESIVSAVETSQYDTLLSDARDAGRYQAMQGLDLSDAVRRTVEATNMIEFAILEANEGEVPVLELVNEVAALRSMIVMAVAEGYKIASAERTQRPQPEERLRAALMRQRDKYETIELGASDEIGPLYDQGMRFLLVESGKLRLYNLLPNGRTITLSILGEGDVFFQWRTETASLSCVCAEAMAETSVIAVSEAELVELLGNNASAAVDVIGNFARRLTESQVLIEDLMNSSVNLRLYRTLLELSRQFGRPEGAAILIDVPLTHQRLADMIGSNRVTITRKLHELQDRGLVAGRGSGTIVVLDRPGLERLAVSAGE